MFFYRSNYDLLLTLCLFVSILVISGLMVFNLPRTATNYEELALGEDNVAAYSHINGYPIHCSDILSAEKCVSSFNSTGGEDAVLWLGNSQVHAVNQLKEGQKTMSSVLYRLLIVGGKKLLIFSQPNANLQEHYLIYQYLKTKLSIRTLILPVVFDDMRETGLREGIRVALDERLVVTEIQKSLYGNAFINSYQKNDVTTFSKWQSVQDKSESVLTLWLEDNFKLWDSRQYLRGAIFYKLYDLRNMIFNIKANSKRKMIKGHFEKNFDALTEILDDAKHNEISIYLYIAPIRHDVELPYIASEYENFKLSVEKLAKAYDVNYANFESIVPAKYWGYVSTVNSNEEPELDFMHFQAKGHEILAKKLFDFIKE